MSRVATLNDQAGLEMSYACIDIKIVSDLLKQAYMDLEIMASDGRIDQGEFARLTRWIGVLSKALEVLSNAGNAVVAATEKSEDAGESTLVALQALYLGWQNAPDSNLRRKLKTRKASNVRFIEAYKRRQERWGRQLVMFGAKESGEPMGSTAA